MLPCIIQITPEDGLRLHMDCPTLLKERDVKVGGGINEGIVFMKLNPHQVSQTHLPSCLLGPHEESD